MLEKNFSLFYFQAGAFESLLPAEEIHCPSVCVNKASGQGHLCAPVTAHRDWELQLPAGYRSHRPTGSRGEVMWQDGGTKEASNPTNTELRLTLPGSAVVSAQGCSTYQPPQKMSGFKKIPPAGRQQPGFRAWHGAKLACHRPQHVSACLRGHEGFFSTEFSAASILAWSTVPSGVGHPALGGTCESVPMGAEHPLHLLLSGLCM